MYPTLKEGTSIGTFQYEDSDELHYYAENADGEEFEIDYRLWKALLKADGTKPLDLPGHGQKILRLLKHRGLVRTSRFVRGNDVFNRFVLFLLSDQPPNSCFFCKMLCAILPVLSVLVFAAGVCLTRWRGVYVSGQFSWLFFSGILACSLALHEVGHLVAGLASGYKISDVGILLLGIIPIGAYVAHEDKKDASKFERIQFALSGVEMNLLIAGICLLVAMQCHMLSSIMVAVANSNVLLAGINLLPTYGLDGESALSAVCEVDSISRTAKKCILNRKWRKKLLRSGFPGYVCLFLFAVTLISKILLWLLICFDVASIIFCFFSFRKIKDTLIMREDTYCFAEL